MAYNTIAKQQNVRLHRSNAQFRKEAAADLKKFNRDKKKMKLALN